MMTLSVVTSPKLVVLIITANNMLSQQISIVNLESNKVFFGCCCGCCTKDACVNEQRTVKTKFLTIEELCAKTA